MKILDNMGDTVKFGKISVGKCFKYKADDHFYLKTYPKFRKNNVVYNCVDLTENVIRHLPDEISVVPVHSRIIIDD